MDILGYLKNTIKSQIWQSETSPNQGIPNQVPRLGLVSLFQIWDFCGYSLNTLQYPKMGICYFSFDSHLHIKSFSLEELCKIQLNIFLYRVCGLLIISTIHTITLQAPSLGDGCCLQVLHSHIPSLVASRPSLDILDVMSSVKLVRTICPGPCSSKDG